MILAVVGRVVREGRISGWKRTSPFRIYNIYKWETGSKGVKGQVVRWCGMGCVRVRWVV